MASADEVDASFTFFMDSPKIIRLQFASKKLNKLNTKKVLITNLQQSSSQIK